MEKKYESPLIEKISISLEQSIAGSVPVTSTDPNNAFQESWTEDTIETEDIEFL